MKNFVTAKEIIVQLKWYEKKLEALETKNLSIIISEQKTSIMTIGATVENETMCGALAVDFIESLKKQLRAEIKSLKKQLLKLSATDTAIQTTEEIKERSNWLDVSRFKPILNSLF